MKHKQFQRSLTTIQARLAAVFLLAACFLSPCPPLAADENEAMFFIVRHAEKQSGGEDPQLSATGEQRSARLAAMLADAGITGVFSTDYNRTRDTAEPLAVSLGLEIGLYDPRSPNELLDGLKARPGRYLVVGHSNTVPGLVEYLGGTPGGPIDEKMEYDRLYVVHTGSGRPASTTLLRY